MWRSCMFRIFLLLGSSVCAVMSVFLLVPHRVCVAIFVDFFFFL